MKRYIYSPETENIFAMSKIVDKYAIPSVAENIGKFVYFSESNSSHGPRITFYGGSSETSSTQNSPTITFDIEGNCNVELNEWMNKKNCPNAFDADYIRNIEKFVKDNKAILLLVWFGKLDEADALAYFHFHGQVNLRELFNCIEFTIPDSVTDLDELDQFCINSNQYKFS